MVVFKVSSGTAESGVQVGDSFFPSFPAKASHRKYAFAFLLTPITLTLRPPRTWWLATMPATKRWPPSTTRSFPRNSTLTRSTWERSGWEISGERCPSHHEPDARAARPGSLIKNFLLINGSLRQEDAHKLVAFSQRTAPRFLWKGPFLRLAAKTEASFADYRTYIYRGQPVDHQTHLGF